MPDTLADWLERIGRLHPQEMELGLERISAVLAALGLRRPAAQVVSVGGTNGKGSCVVYLEGMLGAAGYRTGAYSSPHLLRFNERIRIAGREADDGAITGALEIVDAARGDIRLTYFEFATAAALVLMQEAAVDVAVLEVGLGGRLDAVNALDADVAVITSIGIDHEKWLGPDRESIGREKAGIMRPGRAAICGDPQPPQSLFDAAARTGARLECIGRDFGYRATGEAWSWQSASQTYPDLPLPALAGRYQLGNAACAIAALEQLRDAVPVSAAHIAAGLAGAQLPGRLQLIAGAPGWVLDVAHNEQAALELARALAELPCAGRTLAVAGFLNDKRVEAIARALAPVVDQWFTVTLPPPRGLGAEAVAARIERALGVSASACADVAAGCQSAARAAGPEDRIVVFGSFLTVGPALVDILGAG